MGEHSGDTKGGALKGGAPKGFIRNVTRNRKGIEARKKSDFEPPRTEKEKEKRKKKKGLKRGPAETAQKIDFLKRNVQRHRETIEAKKNRKKREEQKIGKHMKNKTNKKRRHKDSLGPKSGPKAVNP